MGAIQKKKFLHEDFETNHDNQLKLVRQDRYDSISGFKLEIDRRWYDVLNYGVFGICVHSDQPLEDLGWEVEGALKVKDVEIGTSELKLVRTKKIDTGYENGFEILGDPLNLSHIKGIAEAHSLLSDFNSELISEEQVPADFKNQVFELKVCLENLKEKIEEEERRCKSSLIYSDRIFFDNSFSNTIGVYLSNSLTGKFDNLAKIVAKVDKEKSKYCVQFFREQLKHLIYHSPFSEHSIKRPSGYAGDYELMNYLYRDESIGDTLFSKCLHRYYMSHPNAKAVRNRKLYLGTKILEILRESNDKKIKILSVACGPSEELQKLIESNPTLDWSRFEFHLLDQDQNALKYAQRNIKNAVRKTGCTVNVKYLHFGIKNLIQAGVKEKYDLIYSAGLFDYFSHPVASVAAQTLYNGLNDFGKLVIGNFKLVSSHRALMDLALDWNLIYRDEDQLRGIYSVTCGEISIEAEPESINLFAVIKKVKETN